MKKATDWSISEDHEMAHGRDTTRTVLCTTNLTSLVPEIRDRWPELKSLIMVECETKIISTGKERKKEKRCYFGSKEGDAEFFQKAIRMHWSIENQCHWVLDTCFQEDHNQTRKGNAAKNLGAERRIILNILKDDPGVKKSLPSKRRTALMNKPYRERLLSLALITLQPHSFFTC